jgi:hypothetical protein
MDFHCRTRSLQYDGDSGQDVGEASPRQ